MSRSAILNKISKPKTNKAMEYNGKVYESHLVINGEFSGWDHDGEITYTDPYGGHKVTVSGQFDFTDAGWIHTFEAFGLEFIVVANKVN